jgi:hypothetical protein
MTPFPIICMHKRDKMYKNLQNLSLHAKPRAPLIHDLKSPLPQSYQKKVGMSIIPKSPNTWM